jgi:Raf kinase inhibitor-like YbhB/YbcL family protein
MNQSPPLSWTPGPAGTKSYAVTLNHLANGALEAAHWALWDIPATTTSIPADIMHVAMPPVPAGSKQVAINLDGFNGIGYLGPCPQNPNSLQNYRFTVYALGVDTLANPGANTAAVQARIRASVLPGAGSSAALTGTQIQQ